MRHHRAGSNGAGGLLVDDMMGVIFDFLFHPASEHEREHGDLPASAGNSLLPAQDDCLCEYS